MMTTSDSEERDRGSIVILALVLVIIGSLIVLPLLTYASTVLKSNSVVQTKTTRVEAVEGGIRVAMSEPTELYTACAGTGPTTPRNDLATLKGPGLPLMRTSCRKISDGRTNKPGEQRYALTTVQVGSQLMNPAADPLDPTRPELDGTIASVWCTSKLAAVPVPCGRPYPGNGNATTTAWQADIAQTSTTSKVFVPFIPPPDSDPQPSTGFVMPSWHPPCRLFFPGTYNDDVTISGSTPAYFVSGIYHFKKTLRITGGADVVVGTGPALGCVDSDSTAVLSAVDASGLYPNRRQVDGASGVGGTFVFGAGGRLVIDNTTSGNVSLVMNRRLQASTKPEAVMNDVSIVTVNGVTTGGVTTALDIPGQLNVPPSQVRSSVTEPAAHGYTASTLISTATAPASCAPPAVFAATCPVIDINMSSAASVKVVVPGYVATPQGTVMVSTASGAATNKNVSFGGGILAAQVAVSPVRPASLQAGVVETVVQRTFKVQTTTTEGLPKVTATAIVQVNESGGYAINSYTVESGA